MSNIKILPIGSLGRGFIESPYLPEGRDEYYLRNIQSALPPETWRQLRPDEIATLVRNANNADDWGNILVTDQFSPHLVKNCLFYGLVRIGRLEEVFLEHHDMRVAVGITNSCIISCDIGDNVAIHHVRYLAHYIIGNNTILMSLDEMHTTDYAKFGNGIIKDGEEEDVRIWMDLINEVGGRSVMPFDGMIAADAYMWAKNRDDAALLEKLGQITQKTFDSRRGFYGTVGDRCVIKNSRIIKDVKVGPCAYIKGANKLKNLTINSSADEPTQIGEGVEMINGIVGYGCRVFYGCKAIRFVLGDYTNLKYGARLVHSYLGDNSTISCCEVLNNLVYPLHEQHHNNSFLIASLVMGQSNIAACATIGSNHNSRAPDGEIQAGRGFWPGLCVSVKHNCRFAGFTLLAKGDFPAELDVPLPFSLVSNNVSADCLNIMPGYWWLYNMYALARNSWKFKSRDKRKRKIQKIEFESLAPDTAEEMFAALGLLELWTAKAQFRHESGNPEGEEPAELRKMGRELLTGSLEVADGLTVLGEGVEHSSRDVVIIHAAKGYAAYRQMLLYYAVKNLLDHVDAHSDVTLADMSENLRGLRQSRWVNAGGQIIQADDMERLISDIKKGDISTWHAVHEAYDKLWSKYPLDKQRHAFATLLDLHDTKNLTTDLWREAVDGAIGIQRYIAEQTYVTRKKDDDNPFRRITFSSEEERLAVVDSAEKNEFVRQVAQETEVFVRRAEAAKLLK